MVGARAALLLAAAVAAPVGCGGHGTEAPYTIHPDEDTGGCPSADDALVHTRAALDEGALDDLGPHVERILIDDGGIRVLVPAVLQVARQVPPAQALGLSQGYSEGEGLARLRPHFGQVLDYIVGDSDYIDGEHYAVVDVLHALMDGRGRRCDVITTLGAFRGVLLLRVPGPSGGDVPWIEPAFDALVALAEDDPFLAVLEQIQFDDEAGEGQVALGREAFVLVARLALGNLAEPEFDLAYVRGLLEDLLVLQLPEESASRAKVGAVLDQLEVLFDPRYELVAPLQTTLGCLVDVDEAGDLSGMLYDYFSIEELSLPGFLRDLNAFGDDAAGQALRVLAEDGVAALLEEPDLTRDAVLVLNRFLAPEATREVVPALRGLEGKGVFTEVLTFLEHLLSGCEDDET